MDDRTYGARFIDEMRRLTKSSWGMDYNQLQRLAQMDREEFRTAFGDRLAPLSQGRGKGDPFEPEQLARSIVEEGRSSDMLTLMVNILGGLA
jgi:hypothetical protein